MQHDAKPSRIPTVLSAHNDRWILEEAAMAETTFNAAREAQAREQLKAALAAYGEMLDTFVNHPMPLAAAETGHAVTRLVPTAVPKPKNAP
jgi:hypothetical protein